MKIGSEAHTVLFCRLFIDSYRRFEPEQLPWPELDLLLPKFPPSLRLWQGRRPAERKAA